MKASDILKHPIRIGIIGCSSFALRAMVPALRAAPRVKLAAIASRDAAKAAAAAMPYGCRAIEGYEHLINDSEIDAVYLPLPTALHEEWALRALAAGKHVLVEKSLAVDADSANRILSAAQNSERLVLENFLFLRHSQKHWLEGRLAAGDIGELKIFRAAFTIPALDEGNFRYRSEDGGGALLDVGAYMVKSTLSFLGPELNLLSATMEHSDRYGVDVRGSAHFSNNCGVIAQVAWGFDTHYQCTWEFHGTAGRITCGRALTPPPGFNPPVRIESASESRDLNLEPDNHYLNQWNYFGTACTDHSLRRHELEENRIQAYWLHKIRNASRETQSR